MSERLPPSVDHPRRLHLFSALDDEQYARVAATLRAWTLARGERLFSQGETARRFFWLESGAVKLFLLSREGDEKVVEVIRPREFFAEAVMFMEGGAFPVNAEALTESRVLGFDNDAFKGVLEESPALAQKLLAAMSRRLHGLLKEVDELTLHNATYRVCAYLLNHARQVGVERGDIELDIPKNVIASRLSMTPETFSRIQNRLQQAGYLSVEGERIVLRDRQGLQALLEA